MDKYVKQSIEARKKAIFDAYTVGEGEKKKIEAVLAEMEKLGAGCKDAQDFEAKFASSPLNQRYFELLGLPAHFAEDGFGVVVDAVGVADFGDGFIEGPAGQM